MCPDQCVSAEEDPDALCWQSCWIVRACEGKLCYPTVCSSPAVHERQTWTSSVVGENLSSQPCLANIVLLHGLALRFLIRDQQLKLLYPGIVRPGLQLVLPSNACVSFQTH